jgi:hypothetical protein
MIAILALIFLVDDERRKVGIIASVSLVIINVLAVVLKLSFSLFSIESIAMAVLLYISFGRKWNKAESALVLTAVCALFTVANLVLIPMAERNTLDFGEVVQYYEELIDTLRLMFVETAMEAYGQVLAGSGIELTEYLLTQLYNQQLSMIISYIVIICFAVVGIAMKLFSILYARIANDSSPVIYWRFITTSVFAYFYIALMFLSVFTSTSTGVLGIAIGNLYNIFLVVYAYVGFNQAVAMLTIKFRPIVAMLIAIAVTLLAMSLALQLLAVLGVLYTIRKNREAIPKAE